MQVQIYPDEWYPVFYLVTEGFDTPITIPDELYYRYLRVIKEFSELQVDLKSVVDGNYKEKDDPKQLAFEFE